MNITKNALTFTFEDAKTYGLKSARLLYYLHTLPPPGWANIDSISMCLDAYALICHQRIIDIIKDLEPFEVIEVRTLPKCKFPCAICTSVRLKPHLNNNQKNKEIDNDN